MNMVFQIEEGDISTVVELSQQLSEFHQPHGEAEYLRRLQKVSHLILIAFVKKSGKKTPIGFKVGYEREGYFYSWMGGVLYEYRRKGVAQALAKRQEDWASAQGYTSITFKTRNRHRAMLLFGIKNGFQIIGLEQREEVEEHRILLRKELT